MNRTTRMTQILSVILGLLFLSSGVLKALDSQYFASLIASYGFGWAGYLAPVISGTEMILGVMLLLGTERRVVAMISLVLTSLFTMLFAYAYFFKGIDDCGCFGPWLKMNPMVSFLRNIFIIAGSVYLLMYGSPKADVVKRAVWKSLVVLLVACLGFYLGGYSLGKSLIAKNKIKVGDSLHASALRFFSANLESDTGLIFIFSPDCPHCWNVTENVKSIKNISRFQSTIGVTFPGSDLSMYLNEMQPNFDIFEYPTKELGETISEVPLLIVAEKGIIKRIYTSDEIPCGKMLEMAMGH